MCYNIRVAFACACPSPRQFVDVKLECSIVNLFITCPTDWDVGFEYLLLDKCDRHGAKLSPKQRQEWNTEIKKKVAMFAREKGMQKRNYVWKEYWEEEESEYDDEERRKCEM